MSLDYEYNQETSEWEADAGEFRVVIATDEDGRNIAFDEIADNGFVDGGLYECIFTDYPFDPAIRISPAHKHVSPADWVAERDEDDRDAVVVPFAVRESYLTAEFIPVDSIDDADGVVALSEDVVRDAFGEFTDDTHDEAVLAVQRRLGYLSQVLSGEVFYVAVLDKNEEIVDSCGGFVGIQYAEEQADTMLAYARDSHVAQEA